MSETTADPAPDRRPGGSAVPRRLVLGALAALGIGIAVPGELAQEGAAPPPPPPSGGSPLLRGQVVDVRAVGAAGDGRADDGEAIRRGLDAANAVGGTLFFPAGLYRYPAAAPLLPVAGLTISGVARPSTVAFDHGGASDYVNFLEIGAERRDRRRDHRASLRRLPHRADRPGPGPDFTLSRSALVGHQDIYRENLCHGMKFADAGSGGGISITDSTVNTVTYGLFQDNVSTAEMTA